MIKLFADSGSSIKQEEKEALGVELLPLKILLGEREYTDGVDLSDETFYHALIEEKLFPKTSLPSLGETEERVREVLEEGHEVIILCISSGISGTYHTISTLFADEARVRVIDTKTAVGGMRILAQEIRKHEAEGLDAVAARVEQLIPRLRVLAVPQTLEYLHRGGRLSRSARVIGSLLQIKPLISLDPSDGKVKVLGNARGLKRAMAAVADYLREEKCDLDYPIVPSYTYDRKNLEALISVTDPQYRAVMSDFDHLTPAIACHWGPGAFGYIFVSGKA